MGNLLFSNDAATTLASGISNSATSVSLAAGTGSKFPNPSAGDWFMLSFFDAATGLLSEITKCTARSGDVCTIVRAQEGTTALAWNAGDIAGNEWTAGSAGTMLQQGQQQAQATNYAVDTGVANAYAATFSPALTAHIVGAPLRVKIANTNTGASTFDPGPGAKTIVQQDGTPVRPGTIVAGGIYEFVYDGTNYQAALTNVVRKSSGTGSIVYYPGNWVRQTGIVSSVAVDTTVDAPFAVTFATAPSLADVGCVARISNDPIPSTDDYGVSVSGTPSTTKMRVGNLGFGGSVTIDIIYWAEGQI